MAQALPAAPLSAWVRWLGDAAGQLTWVRPAVAAAHARRFNRRVGSVRLFRGIYPDYAAALRDIPADRQRGYDNAAAAQRLVHERLRLIPSDYPILFWLSRLLPGQRLLFDWGGNIGTSYLAYRRILPLPAELSWLVNDVPAVVALGEQLAEQEGAPNLRFTTTLDTLAEADILLAAGSIHFIEDPLGDLARAAALPRHILLNKVPVYDRPAAVTLQNFGSALCPNHLFNGADLRARFEQWGYRLVDSWQVLELGCQIPLFPEHCIDAYSGFYFERAQ